MGPSRRVLTARDRAETQQDRGRTRGSPGQTKPINRLGKGGFLVLGGKSRDPAG